MTDTLEPARTTDTLAPWSARAGAFAVDVLPALGVLATAGLVAWSAEAFGALWSVCIVVAVAAGAGLLVNRWLLPELTGWSVGRAVWRIRVVRRDGRKAGLGRLMLRDVAHLLDTAGMLVGWLWPLWDRRHRTFADMLADTEVHRVPDRPARDARRDAGVLLATATALAVAVAGLGYLAVYRPAHAVFETRREIGEQGPRIVEQMLSYRADSVDEDFARARDLVADGYREQFAAQQEVVRAQGDLVTNEYWAVNSAVLQASADRAEMLIALQGQRGNDPQAAKFITATVRAGFERGDDGRWRVSNLTVLKQPNLNRAGQ